MIPCSLLGGPRIVSDPPPVPWSPANRSWVLALYDAADTDSLTLEAGELAGWADLSGNDRHAVQGDPAKRLQYLASDPRAGGQPSVGRPDRFGTHYLETPQMNVGRVYVVTAYQDGTVATFDGFERLISGPGANGTKGIAGNAGDHFGSGATQFNDAARVNGAEPSPVVLPLPLSVVAVRGFSGSTADQVWRIGGIDGGGDSWPGPIRLVVFTTGTETEAQREQLVGWLAHEAGTQARLVAEHPYRATRPYVIDDSAPVRLIDLSDFTLIWSDEFAGPDLSVGDWDYSPGSAGGYRLFDERWIPRPPGGFDPDTGAFQSSDFGDAEFADHDPASGLPFAIVDDAGAENGKALRITARIDGTKTLDDGAVVPRWRTGILSALDSYGDTSIAIVAGYIEWRMKLPPGAGLWPAAWTLSSRDADGRSVELDALELYGAWPGVVHHVVHYYGAEDPPDPGETTEIDLIGTWHTIGIEITDDGWFAFYLDGIERWRTRCPVAYRGLAHSPLLNLALGPGHDISQTPDPSELLADYVRVYERTPA